MTSSSGACCPGSSDKMHLLESISRRIEAMAQEHVRACALRDAARSSLVAGEDRAAKFRADEVSVAEAHAFLVALSDKEVSDSAESAQALVGDGVSVVFDDQNVRVMADAARSRGHAAINLLTEHQGVRGKSADLFGGSIATVQAVLLRMLVVMRRGLRPFLVLDETLAPLDERYAGNLAEVFAGLCSRLHFDMLVITHSQALYDAAPTAYRVVPSGSASRIVRER